MKMGIVLNVTHTEQIYHIFRDKKKTSALIKLCKNWASVMEKKWCTGTKRKQLVLTESENLCILENVEKHKDYVEKEKCLSSALFGFLRLCLNKYFECWHSCIYIQKICSDFIAATISITKN